MSDFFRFRLRLKEKLVGLSDQDYDDLYYPREQPKVIRNVRDAEYIPDSIRKTKEGEYALNRPAERHVLEALRIQQQQEEEMLREFEAHRQFAREFEQTDKGASSEGKQRKKWWFF